MQKKANTRPREGETQCTKFYREVAGQKMRKKCRKMRENAVQFIFRKLWDPFDALYVVCFVHCPYLFKWAWGNDCAPASMETQLSLLHKTTPTKSSMATLSVQQKCAVSHEAKQPFFFCVSDHSQAMPSWVNHVFRLLSPRAESASDGGTLTLRENEG